jgi:hypothetical protein
VTRLVTDSIAHGLRPVLRLEAPADVTLRVTSNHPVYVVDTGRFRPAGEIADGVSSLVLTSLTSAVAAPLERIQPSEDAIAPVYDLTVEARILHVVVTSGLAITGARLPIPRDFEHLAEAA